MGQATFASATARRLTILDLVIRASRFVAAVLAEHGSPRRSPIAEVGTTAQHFVVIGRTVARSAFAAQNE